MLIQNISKLSTHKQPTLQRSSCGKALLICPPFWRIPKEFPSVTVGLGANLPMICDICGIFWVLYCSCFPQSVRTPTRESAIETAVWPPRIVFIVAGSWSNPASTTQKTVIFHCPGARRCGPPGSVETVQGLMDGEAAEASTRSLKQLIVQQQAEERNV